MKKTIGVIMLLLAAGIAYVLTRPGGEQKIFYRNDTQTKFTDTKEPKLEQVAEAAPASNTPQSNSGNLSPETGWSAFPKADEQPAPDVTAQINIGNGSPDPKTITAKQGQRISITFTASIRDQVVIEGYNYDTYVEPMRDSTLGFQTNNKGTFNIKLVKLKKVIGMLVVN